MKVGGTTWIRLGLGHAAIAALLSAALPVCFASTPATQSSARENAEAQFDRAQKQRATLEATPDSKRTLEQYQDLVKAYRRVYLLTPRAQDVPLAILTVGDLNRQMGDHFDTKYYQAAIDAYQFLLHEYPASRYREDALFAVGQIQKDDLNDRPLAQKTFEEFLQLHPHSPHAKDALTALMELTAHSTPAGSGPHSGTGAPVRAPTNSAQIPAPSPSQLAARNNFPGNNSLANSPSSPPTQLVSEQTFTQVMEHPLPGKIAELRDIKTWTTPDYTRIVIGLDGPVKYQAARVANPERIYFDVSHAHLSHSAGSSPVKVQGDLIKTIRVAQNQAGTVRVVLEIGKIKDYSVFLLRDPYRMVVDVYAKSDTKPATTTTKLEPSPTDTDKTGKRDAVTKNAGAKDSSAKDQILRSDLAQDEAADITLPPAKGIHSATASQQTVAKTVDKNGPFSPPPRTVLPGVTPSGTGTVTNTKSSNSRSARNAAPKPVPPTEPAPTRDGQQSLSRALGLKIGRIVIDAGHGGHDTGTIGPNGLMEKDLCLDVALRLGKLIEQRLPGTEIVYTRSDDTFIPLEERTALANQAKADLFLSIHANSSPDSSARGVETYYLNFSPSPEAMAVASRENATAQNGVHELEDMIQRIARNEKIEESRELAADIQDSLTKRLQRTSKSIRNRGVRKAPFVVLIGANMPSALAEISFISNPTDETSLSKPDGRDRVAEGLYKGIEAYLQGTNSLAFNQTSKVPPGGKASGVASAGNQR